MAFGLNKSERCGIHTDSKEIDMIKHNRARGLFVAQMLAGEISKGGKRKGFMQQANALTGCEHRTKRAALAALVTELRTAFGYVPTRTVRVALAK